MRPDRPKSTPRGHTNGAGAAARGRRSGDAPSAEPQRAPTAEHQPTNETLTKTQRGCNETTTNSRLLEQPAPPPTGRPAPRHPIGLTISAERWRTMADRNGYKGDIREPYAAPRWAGAGRRANTRPDTTRHDPTRQRERWPRPEAHLQPHSGAAKRHGTRTPSEEAAKPTAKPTQRSAGRQADGQRHGAHFPRADKPTAWHCAERSGAHKRAAPPHDDAAPIVKFDNLTG